MRILCCQCNGCGETVMQFVNLGIERRKMQNAVGVIEEDFSEKDAGEDVKDDLVDRRQFGIEAIGWFAAEKATEREENDMDECGKHLVPEDHFEAIFYFRQSWLFGLGL